MVSTYTTINIIKAGILRYLDIYYWNPGWMIDAFVDCEMERRE